VSSRAERMAHVAFAFGVFILAAGVVSNRVDAGRRNDVAQAGQTLVAHDSIPWTAARATLVIALRSSCDYCQTSMPFYTEIAATANRTGGLRVLAMLPETSASASTFLRSHGLAVPLVADPSLKATFAKWGVRGYPTLLLVGQSGRVLQAWHGLQTDIGRDHVRESLALVSGKGTLIAARSGAASREADGPATSHVSSSINY
jgi:peroxiredoxin